MAVDGDENSVSNAAAELSSIIEEDKLLETFSAGLLAFGLRLFVLSTF